LKRFQERLNRHRGEYCHTVASIADLSVKALTQQEQLGVSIRDPDSIIISYSVDFQLAKYRNAELEIDSQVQYAVVFPDEHFQLQRWQHGKEPT
jgi:hypothetical protein